MVMRLVLLFVSNALEWTLLLLFFGLEDWDFGFRMNNFEGWWLFIDCVVIVLEQPRRFFRGIHSLFL